MKNGFKKILTLLISVALILSVLIAIERHNLENDFKQIEMAMSLNRIRDLVIKTGTDENELLEQLKSRGISSIAIHEDSIESLALQGKISFLDTNDLVRLNDIHNISFLNGDSISPGELLIISRDHSLFQRMKSFFQAYLSQEQVREYMISGDRFSLIFQGDVEELVKIGLGFSEEDIRKVQSMGLHVILRPKNSPRVNQGIMQQKLSTMEVSESISMIIFDEEEVLGYPSQKMLLLTADFLQKHHYPFGIIEFASQKGIHTIASSVSELAVRVHSITKEEMEKILPDKAIDRWIRAAQERNIRLFYLNPFMMSREGDIIQANLSYIESIKNELLQNGFLLNRASLFPTYQIPLIFVFFLGLGMVSAGVLFLMKFFHMNNNKYGFLLFMAGIAFLLILYLITGKILLMKIIALASALIFPVLAIIMNKEVFLKPSTGRFSYIEMIKKIIFGLTGIMLISLIGGLMIGALLTHYQFILAIQLFSGIKIAYIFPLIMVAVYLWWIGRDKQTYLWEDLKKPVLFEHAFLVTIFLIFAVIYLARSGNFSFLPVPDIEEKVRLFLEKFLIARPRSKEFFIGYPLLSLAIAMNFLHLQYLKLPIIIMGTVAPVTIVNTFCHVHTSISFSLLRTFHGYWLGLLFGIILTSLFYLFMMIFRAWCNGERKS